MRTPVMELADALRIKPDTLRARLAYYKIGVRGKTLKQIVKAMRSLDLIPEGVMERDGLPPGRPAPAVGSNGNGNAQPAEAQLATRLHGIRERLEAVEPLARAMVRAGTNGPWESYFLNVLHYARTGEELDIQNLVRELKKD